jgi:hypothetical protein
VMVRALQTCLQLVPDASEHLKNYMSPRIQERLDSKHDIT